MPTQLLSAIDQQTALCNHTTMKFCPECATLLKEKEADDFTRLICTAPDCFFTFWNNPTPVAVGLVRLGDDYILARNANWTEGTFSMISGFVEKGEIPEETIKRELKEELGLTANQLDFIGHFKFDMMNQLMIAYHVQASGDIELSEELVEFVRVPHQDLKRFDFKHLVLSKHIVLTWLRNQRRVTYG